MSDLGKIMILDDDRLTLLHFENLFKRAGYEVLVFASAEAALAVVSSAMPDLVILDQCMPDIDGSEFCRRLKAAPSTSAIPIIFCSGAASPRDRISALRAGATDYVLKPVEPGELVARVERSIELARLRRELERRSVQLECRSAELEAIVESVSVPLFSIDREYRYSSFNSAHAAAMKALYGVEIERGANLLDFGSMDPGREAARLAIDRAMVGERLVEERNAGDSSRGIQYFQVLYNPVRNRSGEVTGVVVLALDLSERKQNEESVQRLNEMLEGGIRLRTAQLSSFNEELAAFNVSASHDLEAPLREIEGNAADLAEMLDPVSDAEALARVVAIREGVLRMQGLIRGLIGYSKASALFGDCERIDMDALTRSVFAQLREGRADEVDFIVGDLPAAWGNPGAIRKVMTNLFDNALAFSATRPEPRIRVAGRIEAAECVYDVVDNGVGFDPRYAEKLFGIFQSLHRRRESAGGGLGLATAKRLVIRHGGRIWAEGSPGEGAAFHFSLPTQDPGIWINSEDREANYEISHPAH